MQIRKNSWHYRFILAIWGDALVDMTWPAWVKGVEKRWTPPRTLCGYFWTCVFTGPILLIWAAMTVALWLSFGTFLVLRSVKQLTLWAPRRIVRRLRRRRGSEDRAAKLERPPSILWTAIMAKKRRMCPIIQYVAESDLSPIAPAEKTP